MNTDHEIAAALLEARGDLGFAARKLKLPRTILAAYIEARPAFREAFEAGCQIPSRRIAKARPQSPKPGIAA